MSNFSLTVTRRSFSFRAMLTSLYGTFMLSLGVRCVAAAVALAANIVLARILGVEKYGRYMTFYSAALVVAGLAVRGSDQLLTRELASGAGEQAEFRGKLRRWALRRIIPGIMIAAILYIAWAIFSGTRATGSDPWLIVIAGLSIVGLFPLASLLSGALNGHHASLRSQSLGGIINNVIVLIAVGALWLLGTRHPGASAGMWMQAAGYSVCCIFGWFWLRGVVHKRSGEVAVTEVSKQLDELSPAWSRAARSFFFVTVAAMVVNRLDVVLVSMLAGNRIAGIYVAGARLAQVAMLVAVAVNVVLSPRIARSWRRGESTRVRALLRRSLVFTIVVATIEIFVGVFFRAEIIKVFGPAYSSSATIFMLVLIAYGLWTLAAPGYAFLSMTGSEKVVAGLSWLVAIVNVIAIVTLVPLFGAAGAGAAMIVGFASVLPVLIFVLSKRLKVGTA